MNCALCRTLFENHENGEELYCSDGCRRTQELQEDLSQAIHGTVSSSDSRTFFYPLSFGNLIDRYTILSLRKSHSKSIARQQELGYLLFKCKKSIQTLLGQLFYDPEHRHGIEKLFHLLFSLNAEIWTRTDVAKNDSVPMPDRHRSIFETLTLRDKRLNAIRQLDCMVSGKSTEYRVYNGNDW